MGVTSLGYIGFSVRDPAAWAAYAENVLGLMPATAQDETIRLRADAYAWRFSVSQGEADDIEFAGFEVSGSKELQAIVNRLSEAGIEAEVADAALLKERGVVGLVSCRDPDGLRIEIYFGATEMRERPFVSHAGVSGFVTGDQGAGHIVLSAANMDACRTFYEDILGFRLSDIIRMQLAPEFGIDLEFYHCNPRHHTLALVPVPMPKRLHHFMLQANSLDDVGFAFDRAKASGAVITQSLGKHTNDEMVSFYMQTPAGFEVEFGWGAREVDENWRVVRHDHMSSWGHKRPD